MLVVWLKIDFNSKITELENKIPNVSGFLLTSVFNSKITEVGNKIPDIKNLASKAEVTAVEIKILNVSNLVTKADYAAEITKIKNDYITNVALDARHKEHKLTQREDTINDLEGDASYFRGENNFGDDGMQNDLVFQVSQKYFDSIWDQEGFWGSKGSRCEIFYRFFFYIKKTKIS